MSKPNSQLLYLHAPEVLEFEANIVTQQALANGRWAVQLDHTYFYPTGGGQEHDTGMIGEAQVLDVYKQGDPFAVLHVVDRPLQVGPTKAKINPARRLRHMQHHTAQHLLTQCFIHICNLETLSANINGYTPSTLDLPYIDLEHEMTSQVENLANQIIYEDRVVKSYFVLAEDLARLPVRRIPEVQGEIRIVEIDGFDFTLCGGTHCRSTGQIGLLKIVRLEKQSERLRVHFVAGWQALELFQSSFEIVTRLAASLSVSQNDLLLTIQRQSDQLQKAQKELSALQIERLTWEAERLAQSAGPIHGQLVCLKVYNTRPINDLRLIASHLANHEGLISVLATLEDKKISVVVAIGKAVRISANELLKNLLEPFKGRGGGDARLAQGGGAWDEIQDVSDLLHRALEGYLSAI